MSLSREEISALAHAFAARHLSLLPLGDIYAELDNWTDTNDVAREVTAIAQQHMQQARISRLLGQGKGHIPWDD